MYQSLVSALISVRLKYSRCGRSAAVLTHGIDLVHAHIRSPSTPGCQRGTVTRQPIFRYTFSLGRRY